MGREENCGAEGAYREEAGTGGKREGGGAEGAGRKRKEEEERGGREGAGRKREEGKETESSESSHLFRSSQRHMQQRITHIIAKIWSRVIR